MSVSNRAKAIYEADWRAKLEADHFGQFVAIEPQSREVFIAETLMDAALAAKHAHPTRLSFVIRIGYQAAVHLGATST